MSTLILPTVISAPASVTATATLVTAGFNIPANVLVVIEVINRHTTPASLGTVTLTGSSLGAITSPVPVTVTEGGASATRRLTRFSILSPTDVAGEVLTVTASLVQTGIGLRAFALGGAATSLAIRQTVVANSGGTAVTTLSPGPVLAAFGDAKNGVFASFITSTTAITPKPGFTELTDFVGAVGCQYEAQWNPQNDTTPNAFTVAAATLAGIASEIVAVPNAVVVSVASVPTSTSPGVTGAGFTTVGSIPTILSSEGITVRANRIVLFVWSGGTAAIPPAGLSWSFDFPDGIVQLPLYSSIDLGSPPDNLDRFTFVYQLTLDATRVNPNVDVTGAMNVVVSSDSGTGGNVRYSWQIIEFGNADLTVGARGIIQVVAVTTTPAGGSFFLTPATFGSPSNAAILLAGASINSQPVPFNSLSAGWSQVAGPALGGSSGVVAFFRPNAPASVTGTNGARGADVLIEIAAASLNSPVVTLISPPNGSAISQSTVITIEATDADGDLTTVFINANGETVTATGTTLPAPYSGGMISTLAGPPAGKRFVFPRTGGFAVGSLGISGVATDSQNHTTPFAYAFTVQFVDQPPTPPGPSGPGDAGFVGGAALGCTPCFFSQQELLDLLDRLYPQSYLEPIKVPGPGYELYKGMARLWERVSLAVGHMECGQFILTESGGGSANAPVVFHRQNADAGAVIQKAGTVVSASKSGRRYVLQLDTAFGPTDLTTPTVIVRAEAQGYEYNVRGQRVTARGEIVVGEIDTISLPLQDPPYGDPTIQVQQFLDASGGVPAQLDALGHDRGIDRTPSEPDSAYGTRIRALPDTVSPGAIRRLLGRLLAPYTAQPFRVIETWDDRLQTCWSAPPDNLPLPSTFDTNTFVWNDPRRTPYRNVWLSGTFERGAIIVVLPNLFPILDFGGVWNDPAVVADDLRSPSGQRALSAWSLPQDFSGLSWAWSGYDAVRDSIYKGIWDSLLEILAGGVALAFVLEGT